MHLQLNDLKRALLDKDQLLQEFEYEKSQMQRRMEELGQRLADKSSSLEGSRSVSFPWGLDRSRGNSFRGTALGKGCQGRHCPSSAAFAAEWLSYHDSQFRYPAP